jgi:ribonuclease HI
MSEIIVFTDGSCIQHKAAGYGIYFPNKEVENISKKFKIKPITNQRAELYAIYKAIKIIISKLAFKKIIIYTDSLYSIKSLTIWIHNWRINDWKTTKGKPIKNLDIIKKIFDYLQKYNTKIFFEHVKSHTNGTDFNSISNNKADELAKIGCFGNIRLSDKTLLSK